jgi:hypothetical protein
MKRFQHVIAGTVAAILAAITSGRSADQVLVPGRPALTQDMVTRDIDVTELILDFALRGEDRLKAEQSLIEEWQKMSQAERQKWARNNATWANIRTFRNYKRDLQRTLVQPKLLAILSGPGASERDRWLLGLYEAACRPGSSRNPILVEGDPSLTQLVVDRYGDFLEIMVDLSMSGGFSAAQRQILQQYLVKGWKKMSPDDRAGMLADMKQWYDAAAAGADAQRDCIRALRPKLLAQFQIARDDPLSQWLLGVREGEVKKAKAQAQSQQMQFDAMRNIIRHKEGGYWRTNPNGQTEWVPPN